MVQRNSKDKVLEGHFDIIYAYECRRDVFKAMPNLALVGFETGMLQPILREGGLISENHIARLSERLAGKISLAKVSRGDGSPSPDLSQATLAGRAQS